MRYLVFAEEELERIAFWYACCEIEGQDAPPDYPLLRKLKRYSDAEGYDVDFDYEEN